MENNKAKYPESSIRSNGSVSTYSKIAFDHFLEAQKAFVSLCEDSFSFLSGIYSINEKIIVTIAFSAFATEAFINDFISATLLDEDYRAFDRLSCISKLELISICMFNKRLTRSDQVYCSMKKLFRARDRIAHNKSYDESSKLGMNEEQYCAYEQMRAAHPETDEEVEEELNRLIDSCKKEAIDLLSDAYDALRTMVQVVDFFIQNGESQETKFRMFSFMYDYIYIHGVSLNEPKPSPYNDVMKKLSKPSPNSYRNAYKC